MRAAIAFGLLGVIGVSAERLRDAGDGITVVLHDAVLSITHRSEGLFSSAARIQPGLFGVTAYEGGDIFQNGNGSAWTKRWGVESVGFPLPIQNYNLPQPLLPNGSKAACPGPVNISKAELRSWWDPANESGATRLFHGPWPSSIYPWGNWLPNFGSEAFAYLLGNTWGNGECDTDHGGPPRNATLWGVAHGLSFRLAQMAHPKLRYAHLGNEANAGWYHKVTTHTGEAFAQFFSQAALGVKSVVKDVLLGGAVSCWGPIDGFTGLSQWDWLTALMDASLHANPNPESPGGTNALDFVDFHAYNDGEANANRVEAEVHMVSAYAATRHHVHMPSAISETSWNLPNWPDWVHRSVHFGRRTLPRLRQVFAALAHPDKIFSLQEHDLTADAGGKFSFSGCRGGGPGECLCDGMEGVPNGTRLCATPEMEMYRAMRALRGLRLDRSVVGVQDEIHDVKFATALNEQESAFGALVVAAANFGGDSVPVTLQLDSSLAAVLNASLAPWSSLLLDARSLRPAPVAMPTTQYTLAIVLPPETLLVYTLPLVTAHRLSKTHQHTEIFASDVGVAIDNTTASAEFSTTVVLPPGLQPSAHGSDVRLRFGVKGPAVMCHWWSIRVSPTAPIDNTIGNAEHTSRIIAASFQTNWTATVAFRGGGCRSSPSSKINCSQLAEAGNGVGFAEIPLRNWTLPPASRLSHRSVRLLSGVHTSGREISIAPWERSSYVGVNVSRCAELCWNRWNLPSASRVGKDCVGFRLTGVANTSQCSLLSSISLANLSGPVRSSGEVVTSGHLLLQSITITMKAGCQTSSALPLSYLTALSLVL